MGIINMVQANLFSGINKHSDPRSYAISPAKELGAYETIWAQKETTFKKIADMFRLNPDFLPSDFIPEAEALSMRDRVIKRLNQRGVRQFGIRVHRAAEYPDKLRVAKNPVELLYYQGWWDLVETRCVAIVGSRNVSMDGVKRTQQLVKYLVGDDFTIVSGLAEGVDSAAHNTAIENRGNTIAVIGTPLDENYPKKNSALQKHIAENHLLISQVPVIRYSMQDYRMNRGFFPERNKTMSALTEATIIVEAGETSGTLIQARAAFYQGRKLFILDSCFRNKNLTWPRRFEEKGAIRVREYEDIRKALLNDNVQQD